MIYGICSISVMKNGFNERSVNIKLLPFLSIKYSRENLITTLSPKGKAYTDERENIKLVCIINPK